VSSVALLCRNGLTAIRAIKKTLFRLFFIESRPRLRDLAWQGLAHFHVGAVESEVGVVGRGPCGGRGCREVPVERSVAFDVVWEEAVRGEIVDRGGGDAEPVVCEECEVEFLAVFGCGLGKPETVSCLLSDVRM
jgi:hypothetical protein